MAASHAANTRIIIGIGYIFIECEFSDVIAVIMNNDSIIPSKHSNVDMRWERKISVPKSEKINANMILKVTDGILVIMMKIII